MTKLPAIFASRPLAEVEKLFGDMNNTFLDFDRMFSRFDQAFPVSVRSATFPPVDVIKTEDGYDITLAVAGYAKEDLTVELAEGNVLTVVGKQEQKEETMYLFKGIAARQFTRKWQLLDGDEVASVSLANGLLTIRIKRVVVEPQTKVFQITE